MTAIPAVSLELQMRHSQSRDSVRHWCARAVTGPSVIRVFAKGTKDDLLDVLLSIPIEQIVHLADRADFEGWFEQQLKTIAKAISRRNSKRESVQPGLKWGHAAKVLTIYLRDVVLHSRYFSDQEVKRVTPWLFVPVDSKVMERLKKLGVKLPFAQIKQIATRDDFYFVQNLLAESCKPGIARVLFDDVWADRRPVA